MQKYQKKASQTVQKSKKNLLKIAFFSKSNEKIELYHQHCFIILEATYTRFMYLINGLLNPNDEWKWILLAIIIQKTSQKCSIFHVFEKNCYVYIINFTITLQCSKYGQLMLICTYNNKHCTQCFMVEEPFTNFLKVLAELTIKLILICLRI